MKPWSERVHAFQRQGQDAVRIAPFFKKRTVQRPAAEKARVLGQMVFHAAFGQTQKSDGEDAQKQHQKV